MGGARRPRRVCATARPSTRVEDAGSTMTGSCTCSAFLDGYPGTPVRVRLGRRSTSGYALAANNLPEYSTSIARISPHSGNHRSSPSCGDKRQNGLKPGRLAPSLVSGRDTPRTLLPLVSGTPHLHTIALCLNGLSAAVRRPDSPPSAPLPTP